MCPSKTENESKISDSSIGLTKKLRQADIWFVNKYGLIESKASMFNAEIIRKVIITNIVDIIGPIAFSTSELKRIDSDRTVVILKITNPYESKNLQIISS